MLLEYFGKEPDQITEDELQNYFLYRKNDCNWSPNTMKICHCGIRFFYEHVIRREWHIFKILKSQKEKRLPCALSREEVYAVLGHIHTFHNYAYFATVYACGLRLQEGLHLEVSDIDKDRMLIHVHRGKGAIDRYVPLPEVTCDRTVYKCPSCCRPFTIFIAPAETGIAPSVSIKRRSIGWTGSWGELCRGIISW